LSDESEFLEKNPDALRIPECDSATAKAYTTKNFLFLFDKCDGHLAWKYDRLKDKTVYECEHIKKARLEVA